MQDFLNEASTCSNARLSRRREPYAACDLLDERTVSSRDPVATSAGPRRTRSSSASTLSRPATSPRTCAAACTRRCWCGRRPSRPCPARRSWSSPGSGGRSRRLCSPGRWIRWRATRGWPPATSPPRSPGSVTSRVRAWCPSAGGLAAAAIAEDLIDEYRQFVNPVILGGGTPYFTPLAKPLDLRALGLPRRRHRLRHVAGDVQCRRREFHLLRCRVATAAALGLPRQDTRRRR